MSRSRRASWPLWRAAAAARAHLYEKLHVLYGEAHSTNHHVTKTI